MMTEVSFRVHFGNGDVILGAVSEAEDKVKTGEKKFDKQKHERKIRAKKRVKCIALESCVEDIKAHLKLYDFRDASFCSLQIEAQLLLDS